MEQEKKPKAVVAVLIFKDGKILLGKRKGSHGAGEYAPPGGHVEYMESFEGCARREVQEETGMEIENIRFLRLLNSKSYSRHGVNIGMISDWKSGEPLNREPDKAEGWDWYEVDKLPEPLFSTVPTLIEAYKTGKNFWDA